MKILNIIFLNLIFVVALSAQCFDADASIWVDTWTSCEESANPKAEYGNGHWIQYNFGSVRKLSNSWVWNTNDPARLNQGFNQVQIDYSSDGVNWTNYGEMTFPMAAGDAVYGGFPGPILVDIEAQYVLVTALSNHGHSSCSGIAEIKFNLLPDGAVGSPPEDDEEEEEEEECAAIEEFYIEDVTETEAYIAWEYEGEEEVSFNFEYGTDDAEWTSITVEEAEIFLENLTPFTTYEFTITIECEGELLSSEVGEFTTGEGEEDDGEEEGECCIPEEVIIDEVTAYETYLYWECEEEIEGEMLFIFEIREEGGDWVIVETEEYDIFIDEQLEPNTTYEVRVGVECEGEMNYSAISSFTTLEDDEEDEFECGQIEDIWLEDITETEAFIEWEGHENYDFYLVRYQIKGEDDWEEVETDEPEIFLEDLEQGYEYELSIGVLCEDKIVWSEFFYFYTIPDVLPTTNISNVISEKQKMLKLYPNPTNGKFAFDYQTDAKDILNYSITDLTGRVLARNVTKIKNGLNTVLIDLSNFPDGVYYLNTLTLDQRTRISKKVVKVMR